MSKGLTAFSKADLDYLAGLAGLGPFPDSENPAVYGSATAWNKTTVYAVNAIVYDPCGAYWRCISIPPAGTPVTHTGYWTPSTPDWVGYMNTVRNTLLVHLVYACRAVAPGAALTLWEQAVCSGPWEVPLSGELAMCRPLDLIDPARPNPEGTNCVAYGYCFTDAEVLADTTNCRLDLHAPMRTAGTVLNDGTTCTWRLHASWSPVAKIYGSIRVEIGTGVGSIDPAYPPVVSPGGGTEESVDGNIVELTWTFTGASVSGLDLTATVGSGGPNSWYFIRVLADVDVRWEGGTPALASNVISTVNIYRSRCCSPLPRMAVQGFEFVAGVITAYDYAAGANQAGVAALPVQIDPGSPLGTWRFRAKSQPASGIKYSQSPVYSGETVTQREWYPALPLSATPRTIPLRAAQMQIREIDTLFARRDLAAAEQHQPQLARASAPTTRAVLSANVGYKRSGDTSPRALATVGIAADKSHSRTDLGRANAIIVWGDSILPLLWDGTGIWLSANGLLSATVPNAGGGWTWAGEALGFYTASSESYDNLVLVAGLLV